MRLRSLVRALFVVGFAATPAAAQLRGGTPARPAGTPAWWFGGGIVAAAVGTVSDGASGSTWAFDGDPRWQLRGALEKAVSPTTTLGLAVNYGTVDFRYAPFAGAAIPVLAPDAPTSVAQCVSSGCTGQLDLWGAQAVVRGGGAREGLHQLLELTAGVIGFRALRAKDDGAPLPARDAIDVNAGIGYGFGYAFDAGFHVGFVQDWGIAWHRGAALPEGTGRTYRTRNSRLTIRYGLGALR